MTWGLSIENADVASALGIALDVDPVAPLQFNEEQVWHSGAPASVCPACGQWRAAGGGRGAW